MSIKKEFEIRADRWEQHCDEVSFSSNINKYLDHSSFDEIVRLGNSVIPWIMERYKVDELPWEFVLQ